MDESRASRSALSQRLLSHPEAAVRPSGDSVSATLRKFDPRLIPVAPHGRLRILLKPVHLQVFPKIGETGFEPATARPPAGEVRLLRVLSPRVYWVPVRLSA